MVTGCFPRPPARDPAQQRRRVPAPGEVAPPVPGRTRLGRGPGARRTRV